MGALESRNFSGTLGEGEIELLQANTKLTEEEIKDLYKDFKKGGGATGGTINRDEFRDYYKRFLGIEDKDGILADHAFAAFDHNHDGFITFIEFVLAIVAQQKTDMKSILNFCYKAMDTSGDGLISFDELKTYLDRALILTLGKDEASLSDPNQIAQCIYGDLGLQSQQRMNKQQFIQGCQEHPRLAQIFTSTPNTPISPKRIQLS